MYVGWVKRNEDPFSSLNLKSYKVFRTHLAYVKGNNGWSEVTQSCPTLCNPVDCSLPGFSVHGILQARILEWLAIAYYRVSTHSTYYFLRLKFPSGLIYSKWLPPCTDEMHGNVEGHTVAFPLFLDNCNCFRALLTQCLGLVYQEWLRKSETRGMC